MDIGGAGVVGHRPNVQQRAVQEQRHTNDVEIATTPLLRMVAIVVMDLLKSLSINIVH